LGTPTQPTRRELMAGAGAGVALAVAALPELAAAGSEPPTKSAPELLRGLLAVELLLISVYRRVIATGLLSPRVERVARHVMDQEHVHVQLVRRELSALGGRVPPAVGGADALDKALSSLKVSGSVKKLHTEHDCVHLLLELETAAEGEYYKAILQLHDVRLAHLAAQLLASEAQHQTAVSEARRPGNAWQAAPSAFVKGKS
jgi:Ferritin-like domain